MQKRETYTKSDTATILGISPATLMKWEAEGIIHPVADAGSGRPVYAKDEVRELLMRNAVDAAGKDAIRRSRERRPAVSIRGRRRIIRTCDIADFASFVPHGRIEAWMTEILGLSSNELLLYAYILEASGGKHGVFSALMDFSKALNGSAGLGRLVIRRLIDSGLVREERSDLVPPGKTLFIPLIGNEEEARRWAAKQRNAERKRKKEAAR